MQRKKTSTMTTPSPTPSESTWTGWTGRTTDTPRLRYNGYVWIGDALTEQDDLKNLRGFSNLIGMVSAEHSLRSKYPDPDLPIAEKDRKIEEYLRKENERLRILHSMGFTVGWPLPLSNLVKDDDLTTFRAELRRIERLMPEMKRLEMVYLFDEPNFTDVPAERLEAFVDAFKEVFPNVKTLWFYAIVHPQFLDARPPSNADILGIDPYMFTRHYAHTAADLEFFYRESLACAIEWIQRYDKPWLMAGDCFHSRDPEGKKMPRPDTTLWYYLLALTQPRCLGLLWFYSGRGPIESENLLGLNLGNTPEDVLRVHREIGESIFGDPTPLGLQWKTFGPAPGA